MKKRILYVFVSLIVAFCCTFPLSAMAAEKPIVVGVPSSLKTLEASEALKAITMAVEEINANGGVQVGDKKRPMEIASIDTRGGEPGVPIADALLAIEKLFLEKKPDAVVLGPFRSEVLLAAMDIYSKVSSN